MFVGWLSIWPSLSKCIQHLKKKSPLACNFFKNILPLSSLLLFFSKVIMQEEYSHICLTCKLNLCVRGRPRLGWESPADQKHFFPDLVLGRGGIVCSPTWEYHKLGVQVFAFSLFKVSLICFTMTWGPCRWLAGFTDTYIFFKFLLLQYYSCPSFSPSALLHPAHPHFQSIPHHCPCPWVVHPRSLTSPSPLFPTLSSSPLPSSHWLTHSF